MIYFGTCVQLDIDAQGIAELRFDRQDGPVNKLDRTTLHELQAAVEGLIQEQGVRGLLVSSGKPAFIVGADITEFTENFRLDDFAFKAWLRQTHKLFSSLENLPYPSVAAINGMAVGGGFEVALCCDYRVQAEDGRVGLPEVNLGIYPAWGGTVRFSRLVGLQDALDGMLTGRPLKPSRALEIGAVDQIVPAGELENEARSFLVAQIEGGRDYLLARRRKRRVVEAGKNDEALLFEFKKQIDRQFGAHYPAPRTILELVRSHRGMEFDAAIEREVDAFPALAKGPVARSLIGLFLHDALLKRKAKAAVQQARTVDQAAVLGAGIMGGGIAYQSAATDTPILMKDIQGEALELGLAEADKLLSKQVERGRLSEDAKAEVYGRITPTLDYQGFDRANLVVEAVVENPEIKAVVLAEVEQQLPAGAVLASNTSSISISRLAKNLKAPENFCGMHFFNPVHAMPLVEVIRGEQSSEETIATTVAYAASLGKAPIVVNDCPGFLVNRILFPYFNAFNRLLKDGVNFQRIDKVMEDFGWPMGPAYLADVVGIDTLIHADEVMVEGFPERMAHNGEPVVNAMAAKGLLGQKSGQGFYRYGINDAGKRFKEANAEVIAMAESMADRNIEISDHEIGERMLLPLCLEAVRCLEEEIAETAAEVDMGLILGLGFPRFRGGPLRYIDTLGLKTFCALVEKHQELGPLYRLTAGLRQRLAADHPFFDH